MINRKLQRAWYNQKYASKMRGIEFSLTFDEWLEIWQQSGKLSLRGRNKGQYVMARFGDKGPYSKENVRIITNSENTKENWELKREEIAPKMSKAHLGKPKFWLRGRPHSKESRVKQAESRKRSGYHPIRAIRSLSDDQVREIKRRSETVGYNALALELKIDPNIVYQILKGRTYKDVE